MDAIQVQLQTIQEQNELSAKARERIKGYYKRMEGVELEAIVVNPRTKIYAPKGKYNEKQKKKLIEKFNQ